MTAKLRSDKLPIRAAAAGDEDPSAALLKTTDCFFGAACAATPVYDGLRLKAGNVIHGGAIIQEPTATSVIPPGHVCAVDAFGDYVITPEIQASPDRRTRHGD